MGTVIHSVVDKATLVSCRASPCEAGTSAMCKSEPTPTPKSIIVKLDDGVLIALVASVAVVLLLLLVLLVFCFIRNRRQKEIIERIRRSESIDENPDYGIYRDGCAEYSTVTDTNSKFEAE